MVRGDLNKEFSVDSSLQNFLTALDTWIRALKEGASRKVKDEAKMNLYSAKNLYEQGIPARQKECSGHIDRRLSEL